MDGRFVGWFGYLSTCIKATNLQAVDSDFLICTRRGARRNAGFLPSVGILECKRLRYGQQRWISIVLLHAGQWVQILISFESITEIIQDLCFTRKNMRWVGVGVEVRVGEGCF